MSFHSKQSRWRGAALGLSLVLAGTAQAQTAEERERCATRVSIALRGLSPDSALLTSANPQSKVAEYLNSTEFQERFARFINATMNVEAGATSEQDSAYHLARYLLVNNRPWRELFVGPYNVALNTTSGQVEVTTTDDGLGYFRSPAWVRRYAGNEPNGVKIVTAYRMMNNVIGLELKAAVNNAEGDISAEGRKAPACAGCHYNTAFALDNAAKILSRRVGTGDSMTFTPPTEGPQVMFNDVTVTDDKSFITAMVNSTSFKFRTCRLAFLFLYGRPEHTCEAALFDACMDRFEATGMIQDALSAVATDASFCQ
jgi:hypothetical protein